MKPPHLCSLLAIGLLTIAASLRAEDVRVLSFNIRYANPADGPDRWEHRREAVAALIAREADVAGLQEVLPAQRAELVERLPDYGYVGVGRDPDDRGESSPIFFRKERFKPLESGTFWLSDRPEEPGSRTWGAKLARICTWVKLQDARNGTAFYLYNTHLDHQSNAAREKSIPLIQARIAARGGADPVVLTGDFNMRADDAAFAPLTLVSTYQALGVPAEGTFHAFSGKAQAGAIDFIFTEKDRWVVRSTARLQTTYQAPDGTERFVSDHFPVVAVLMPKA